MFSRFLRRRNRRKLLRDEPLYFSRLKHLSDDEWRTALSESPAKAARWVYAAATYGNVDAQLYWAQMLLDGYGTKGDPDGAFRWFQIAAQSERPDALNMLGRCYERGWGVEINFERAADCYRRASDKSYDWAQFNLACLLLDGRGAARDVDEAFRLFTKAADQGHVKSFNMIGRCCEHGWGRPRDMAAAADWYQRSAASGDFRGQYRYGLLLFDRGASGEAEYWLTKAIESAPDGFRLQMAEELLVSSEALLQETGRLALKRLQVAE